MIQYAIHHNLKGAYNVAGDPLFIEDYAIQKGKKIRFFPWLPVKIGCIILSPFWKKARLGNAWIDGAKYEIRVCCDKLIKSGFPFPLKTSQQCIEEALLLYSSPPQKH